MVSESRRAAIIERWHERAAIMEYDGGLDRVEAERQARIEVSESLSAIERVELQRAIIAWRESEVSRA